MAVLLIAGQLRAGGRLGTEEEIDRAGDAGARALIDSAKTMLDLGKYREATPLFERGLELKMEKWGRGHPETVAPMLGLASILNEKGDFAAAKNLYEQCLETAESTREPVHTDVIEAATGLAKCLENLGAYADAAAVLRGRLNAVVENRGAMNAEAGILMLNLAGVLDMLGRQSESTRLYRQAAAIIENVYGPEHLQTAAALSGLAHVQRRMGNSPEAASLYKRCIEIVENHYGSPHPHVVHYRSRLGMCLFERQGFDEAIHTCEQAVSEASEIYGADSYQVALEKRHLGLILEYVDRTEEAYAVLRGSLLTLENYFGPAHPYLSKCLKGLASVSYKLGALDEALAYIERAVSLYMDTAGRDQYELSLLLGQQALFEMYMGRWKESVEHAAWATEKSLAAVEDNYQVASVREALLYATRANACLANLVSAMALQPDTPDSTQTRVFSLVIRTQGQVLDRMAERQRYLDMFSDTSAVAAVQKDFAAAAQRVSDLAVRGPGNDHGAYISELARARREQEEAEQALSAASERMRTLIKTPGTEQDISPKVLAESLPPGATLIHFVDFGKWEDSSRQPGRDRVPYYGAFRLRKTDTVSLDLRFVEIGPVLELQSLVFSYREAIDNAGSGRLSARQEAEFRSVARRLYDQIWAPLKLEPGECGEAASADAAKTVFLVLDSWLNVIDFNTLIAPDGELVIEKWKLHLLSSARDLGRPARVTTCGTGLLAVGNPSGDGIPPRSVVAVEPSGETRQVLLCDEAYQGAAPLPGAETETRSVARLISKATGEPTIVLLGAQGNEDDVKRSITGKRVVHFATHGFFCAEDQKSTLRTAERLVDPLLMSGLILAPVSGCGDGLLTAQEVIGLDLRGLDWVVLSACGSGLGRLFRGEGVLGLGRAFELAGARTVITALWRINDNVTRGLMERIYQLRFEGRSTMDAVRLAQLERLRDQRRRLNRVHPALWGGIVAQGDWR